MNVIIVMVTVILLATFAFITLEDHVNTLVSALYPVGCAAFMTGLVLSTLGYSAHNANNLMLAGIFAILSHNAFTLRQIRRAAKNS